jgi:predicted neutral ceramidase superfamily lipid hydrolase
MSDTNTESPEINMKALFIRFLYLGAGLSMLFTNQGTLETIIMSRNICLGIICIACVSIIALQMADTNIKTKSAPYVGLYSIIIGLCSSYIYYINKSYQISANDDIITNVYSNSFIYMMVILSFYLGYTAESNIPEFTYRVVLLFCCVLICLIYPLIITLVYYKTDGFHNIKNIYF